MKRNTQLVFQFTLFITLLLFIAFGSHLLTLHLFSFPLFDNKITISYLLNCSLTILIFGALILLKKKYAASLGYLFFVGSFIKFIAFFVLIYPSYKEDGVVTTLEFTSFFIPYAIFLTFEIAFLVNILNKEN